MGGPSPKEDRSGKVASDFGEHFGLRHVLVRRHVHSNEKVALPPPCTSRMRTDVEVSLHIAKKPINKMYQMY